MGHVSNKIASHLFEPHRIGDITDKDQAISRAKSGYFKLERSLILRNIRDPERMSKIFRLIVALEFRHPNQIKQGLTSILRKAYSQKVICRGIGPGNTASVIDDNAAVPHRGKGILKVVQSRLQPRLGLAVLALQAENAVQQVAPHTSPSGRILQRPVQPSLHHSQMPTPIEQNADISQGKPKYRLLE